MESIQKFYIKMKKGVLKGRTFLVHRNLASDAFK